MNKILNLGDRQAAIVFFSRLRDSKPQPFDLRITNSHIVELNRFFKEKVFRKDALYVGTSTLWEITQPIGGSGRHHYHGLAPEDVYEALYGIRNPKEVKMSYFGRYIIVTLATFNNRVPLAVIVDPESNLQNQRATNIIRIVTIYPYNKK